MIDELGFKTGFDSKGNIWHLTEEYPGRWKWEREGGKTSLQFYDSMEEAKANAKQCGMDGDYIPSIRLIEKGLTG